jgi:hypothetical protein
MFSWMKRRKISGGAKRRLMIALARSEDELIETHVSNALAVMEAVGEELTMGHALELYLEALDPGEPRSTIVARRVLARLEHVDTGRRRTTRKQRRAEGEDGE